MLKKYPNDLKIVYKNFPLNSHKQAKKAAKYALAAGKQGKYKEMYKKIFTNFRGLRNNEDLPLEYAEGLGLNVAQLKADLNDPSFDALIAAETNQIKSLSPIRLSVPKLFVNGKVAQKRDLASLSAMIDAELKKK